MATPDILQMSLDAKALEFVSEFLGNRAPRQIIVFYSMMAENTEFERNYWDNEQFSAFINTRVFPQALAKV